MDTDPSGTGAGAAARLALQQQALVMGLRAGPGLRTDGHATDASQGSAAGSADDAPRHRHRQRLYGRLAALFFAGSGALGLITLPLPRAGSNTAAMAGIFTAALITGIAVWFAPWERWPRWVSLSVVPPAFALISLGNAFGGPDQHNYGVFYVVTFVWIGMAQPRRTSVAMAPLAATAYILPLLTMPAVLAGLSSAAIAIPICVLVGEGIAWGVGRHEQIELALQRERDMAVQLRELDEMKDAFLSAVSHELRTPITICRGHLEVLGDGAGEAEVRAVKETLVDELALMGRLVEDLATLAQVDDRALLRLESVPVNCFLYGTAAKAEPILGRRLRVDECGTEGVTLRADPQRISQALLNLVRNAAQHAAGDGPVHLRATAEQASLLFEVTDCGGGVPPGQEEKLFEPFTTGSSGSGGTGLGLAIVRGIARAHGGEAGLSNRPGLGASFWIRIPQ